MNTTVNRSSCPSLLNPTADKIGQTFGYCLILVASLVGNSIIGLIVYKTPTLRKPINYYITNMAMSDLLYPIFLFPLRIAELYVDSWIIGGSFGQALCKLSVFLPDVSTLVSIQSLVLIAVDRFVAVVFPLRSPLISPKLCPFVISATWIVAMAVHSPYFFAFKLVEYPAQRACVPKWTEAFGESSSFANYYLAGIIVFFYIPIVLLIILYSIILIKLKSQVHPGEHSANAEEQRTSRNRSAIKMAIAIVAGFVFCWVPFTITVLLVFFLWDRALIPCGFIRFKVFARFFAACNCVINPLICLIFSSNYRQGLKRLLNGFGAIQE